MSNVAIYYSMNHSETSKEVIERIEKLISNINEKILGVYIDHPGSSDKFNVLINENIRELKVIYINVQIEDEFNLQLIHELARTHNFKIHQFL